MHCGLSISAPGKIHIGIVVVRFSMKLNDSLTFVILDENTSSTKHDLCINILRGKWRRYLLVYDVYYIGALVKRIGTR